MGREARQRGEERDDGDRTRKPVRARRSRDVVLAKLSASQTEKNHAKSTIPATTLFLSHLLFPPHLPPASLSLHLRLYPTLPCYMVSPPVASLETPINATSAPNVKIDINFSKESDARHEPIPLQLKQANSKINQGP